ncbi:MAG: SUMF1/EgtB/PvdO family nonheme iron enzyme [Magnetococcales bacterium]|nr:SUMF1/EgtB/PvdO family nonheme iron enzyme [Magnetococcales bacterium]
MEKKAVITKFIKSRLPNLLHLLAVVGGIIASVGLAWYFFIHEAERSQPETSPLTQPAQPVQNRVAQKSPTASPQQAARVAVTSEKMVTLWINSFPRGAAVILSGKKIGTTPMTIPQIAVGSYSIKMEKVGYIPVATALELQDDTIVDLSLENYLKDEILSQFRQPAANVDATGAVPPSKRASDQTTPALSVAPLSPPLQAESKKVPIKAGLDASREEAKLVPAPVVEKQQPTPPAAVIPTTTNTTLAVAAGKKMVKGAGGVWIEPNSGMEFVLIGGGCFSMGNNFGEEDEKPLHKVCIDDFMLGRHEVTHGQWQRIMGEKYKHATFAAVADHPLDSVSWSDAMAFIERLDSLSDAKFRLPSEAEWEFACRGGGDDQYQSGKLIAAGQANFSSRSVAPGQRPAAKSPKGPIPVGSFKPNKFGLYDMHGNMYEWVSDWYVKDFYQNSPTKNPLAQESSSFLHILRGGAWYSSPEQLRCSYRYRGRPSLHNNGVGFRVVAIRQ